MNRSIFKQQFDTRLESFLTEKIQERDLLLYDTTLQALFAYIQPFSHEGKRIRPYNLYLRYHACGGTDSAMAFDLSLSLELIQLFALIHDDIVDQGTLRHGIATYHRYLHTLYPSEAVATGQAMLMGDVVYTRAVEHFTQNELPADVKKQLRLLLKEVLVGEILDVHMSHTAIVTDPSLIPIKDKLKSGYYTFKRPMLLGATLAQADPSTCNAIEALGEDLGLAFQMRDDLLDIIDPKANKTPFSDHQEWNQTSLFLYALHHCTTKEKQYLLDTRWKPLDTDTIVMLRTIFETSGAIQHSKDEINALLAGCTRQLTTLFPEKNDYVDEIENIIAFLNV